MSVVQLEAHAAVCWRPGKAGGVDVVGDVPVAAVPPHAVDGRLAAGAAAPTVLRCVTEPERELVMWLGWKGCHEFKKAGKGVRKVLHVCATTTHSGVFYTHHSNKRLGFALVAHDEHRPEKLVSKPALYAEELATVLGGVLDCETTARTAPLVTVRQAALRHTAAGHVLAAALVNRRGEVYAVTAHLATNEWRKWRVDTALAASPCLLVSTSGRDVRWVHCDVAAPCDPPSAITAPSLPLALTTFDRVSATEGDVAAVQPSSSPSSSAAAASVAHLRCVTFCELVLPTRAADVSAVVRRFESLSFTGDSGGGGYATATATATPPACRVYVDEATAVFTIVVPHRRMSCVVHAYHPLGAAELVTSCAVVAGLLQPISACTLVLPHPRRHRDAHVSLLLADDMKLYGCEQFGDMVAVRLGGDGGGATSPTVTLPAAPPPKKNMFSSNKAMAAAAASAAAVPPQLVPLRDQTEVLCCDGSVGLFLRVTSAQLSDTAPTPAGALVDGTGAASVARRDLGGAAEDAVVGAVALRQCVEALQQLSVRTTRHDLPDVVFRHVLPLLRYVGTSQQEVMLMQRVYEQLLLMAAPNLESEWNYLWVLTSHVQKSLAKRGRDQALRYTDAFFLQLADTYRQSSFASTSGTALVADAVHAVVSAEVQDVVRAPAVRLTPEASYVLDGLASGVPPLALAEEVVRRMVRTETATNGACVVAAQPGAADCVHCMGCVLLASCLDLRIHVNADEARGLHVSQKPPPVPTPPDGVSVAVPPYTFAAQAEFDTALVLAGDLLCVPSAGASFRPALALATLSIGGRQHCLAAVLQLFAPVLRRAAESVAPLSDNRAWFEQCAATMTLSPAQWVADLVCRADGGDDDVAVTASLCRLLCPAPRTVDAAVFRSLARTLSEELCTTCLVVGLVHQTERLLAAAQNYAAAIAGSVAAAQKSDTEQDAAVLAADVGRRRLRAAVAQTSTVWAQMDSLSPYRIGDVAESYRASCGNSLTAAAGAAAAASAPGTMVSRTLVMCFRLFCLVQYSLSAEEDMRAAATAGPSRWGADDAAFVLDCEDAVTALALLVDAPFPLEWLQSLFISLVQRAATAKPAWTPYLVRLLQLSRVAQCSRSAAVKRDYYALLDALQSRGTVDTPAALHSAVAAAEAAVGALDVPAGRDGVSVCFLFSHTRDDTLPRWTHAHALQERRFLFSADWVDVLWRLERVPGPLLRVCTTAVSRVERAAAAATAAAAGTGAQTPAPSEELARPLYAHLCRLRPPVRLHAVTTADATAADDAPALVRCGGQRGATSEEVVREAARTPEKVAPPTPAPQPLASIAAAVPAVAAAAATVASPSSSPSPPPHPAQGAVATAAPVAQPPPAGVAHTAALSSSAATAAPAPAPAAASATHEGPSRAGLYSAADVAWWETLKATPPSEREADARVAAVTATAEENGESCDSATTYTTSTSHHADPLAALGSFHRGRHATRGGVRAALNDAVSSRASSSSSGRSGAMPYRHRRRRCAADSSPPPPLQQQQHHHRRQQQQQPPGVTKTCRCCNRALRCHCRSRSPCTRRCGERVDDAALIRVRWGDEAAAETARPSLLRFTRRLQPPEEPQSLRVESARAAPAWSPPATSAAPSLLTLPTSASRKGVPRVRLYALDGERARLADGSDAVALNVAGRGDSVPGLLGVPPLPATSVLTAPQPLVLHRAAAPPQQPQQQQHQQEQHVAALAPSVQCVEEERRLYAQVPRAPTGAAPCAVDMAALHAHVSGAGSPPVATSSEPAALSGLAASAAPLDPATAAAAPAAATVTLAVPTVPPVSPGADVLNPGQWADFRRYTDNLLARQTASAPVPATPALPGSTAAPTPAAAPAAAVDTPGVARLLQQQEDFMRKAEVLMETRQAESEGFYRRVVESIRGLTAASQHLRGLSPVEQAQLVQSTVKQRNELLSLNHQLLEMQLAAARAGGEAPTAPSVSPTAPPVAVPSLPSRQTASGATQTHPHQRESVGVSWAAPDSSVAVTAAAASGVVRGHAGMRETLSDLQRLNTELMAVSASAEAMDAAIKETREVIQRYERGKTAEALTAEGLALTAAMRQRTAAVERRLAELPRAGERLSVATPAAVAGDPAASSRVWVSQSSAAAGEASRRTPPVADTADTATTASHFTATAEERVEAASTGPPPQQQNAATHTPTEVVLDTAPRPGTSASHHAATPPPAAAAALLSAQPSTATPVFTSVSSSLIVADAAPPPAVTLTAAPAAARRRQLSVALPAERGGDGEAPSLHAEEVAWYGGCAGLSRAAAPPSLSAPRAAAPPPVDLARVFQEAGGRYDTARGAGAPSVPKRAAAPPLRRVPQCSAAPTPHAAHRRAPTPARYAMYSTASQPPTARTIAAATPTAPVVSVSPHTDRPRASVPDAFGDRRRSRRTASIAQRMEQLERDLFQ
ncbi:hypothetical protein NESM_000279900 [Novymonas esmeraldas]|uniref:Uncharacterized protein n=1 Tax=Novymonas esmeraldas TaxID=1808958 RepID=A0AAW0F7A6_9TRYP